MTPPFSPDAARELAERLRRLARQNKTSNNDTPNEAADSLLSAASEVERLAQLWDDSESEVERLQTENQQLRDALKRIFYFPMELDRPGAANQPHWEKNIIRAMADISREALAVAASSEPEGEPT